MHFFGGFGTADAGDEFGGLRELRELRIPERITMPIVLRFEFQFCHAS